MKKGLLVFTIITTVIATVFLAFNSLFFGLILQNAAEPNENAVAGIFTGFFGLIFFIVSNFFSIGTATLNFVPNLIHFIRSKRPVVIVLFVIACLILAATVGMLIYLLAGGLSFN